ncbi:Eukaryotic peptide chain release factor GTP-binding subunit [Glycine soja]|nr:Eukaryotic peptide chain release factor GTP-binding subunit [Glycine soja]
MRRRGYPSLDSIVYFMNAQPFYAYFEFHHDPSGPFRMPIIDRVKDMGAVVMGKVESGTVRVGDSLLLMPNKDQVKVVAIFIDEDRVKCAGVTNPIPALTEFVAQLVIPHPQHLDGTRLFCTSTVVEECEIVELLQQIDTKTKKPLKKKVLFVKNGAVVVYHVQVNNSICIEKFSDFPQLGRFTLRTEGKTVAVGKVTGL